MSWALPYQLKQQSNNIKPQSLSQTSNGENFYATHPTVPIPTLGMLSYNTYKNTKPSDYVAGWGMVGLGALGLVGGALVAPAAIGAGLGAGTLINAGLAATSVVPAVVDSTKPTPPPTTPPPTTPESPPPVTSDGGLSSLMSMMGPILMMALMMPLMQSITKVDHEDSGQSRSKNIVFD